MPAGYQKALYQEILDDLSRPIVSDGSLDAQGNINIIGFLFAANGTWFNVTMPLRNGGQLTVRPAAFSLDGRYGARNGLSDKLVKASFPLPPNVRRLLLSFFLALIARHQVRSQVARSGTAAVVAGFLDRPAFQPSFFDYSLSS